jgi:hypothetical protein
VEREDNAAVTLPPGRELDVLVARALGFTNIQVGYWFDGLDWCGTTPDGTGGWRDTGRTSIPRYSTHAAFTNGLLAALRERGVCVQYPEALDDNRWFCCTASEPAVIAVGETATHAVCLVLVALESEKV